MDGTRPLRARIDRNEDGKLDRWEYYDEKGQLTKVGFSRSDDGKPDAWAFAGPDGKVVRIEISSAKDEKKIDRWEQYEPKGAGPEGVGALLEASEDTNGDGKPDKWETYDAGDSEDRVVRRRSRRTSRSPADVYRRDPDRDRLPA